MLRMVLLALGVAAGAATFSQTVSAQGGRNGDWEELGCVDVGRRVNSGVITVGRREGRYSALMLDVSGNDVRIENLRIVYGNGEADDLRVREAFREGARSRPIDLEGRGRFVDSVEITSARDFRGGGRGRATICVSGLQDDRGNDRRNDRTAVRGEGRWDDLGCVAAGRREDRDIIEVGRREGRYSALRLAVTGNDANIDELVVVYANGTSEELRVRDRFREGTISRDIDLAGQDRAIDRIEIVAARDIQARRRGRAQICVAGLQTVAARGSDRANRYNDDRRGDRQPDRQPDRRAETWLELGCKKVGLLADRDVVPVGRSEGRFDAIKLSVHGNDIFMLDLKVVYASGRPDDVPVRALIREGSETRPLHLQGRERAISRVEMVYQRALNFKGSARVCVSGRTR